MLNTIKNFIKNFTIKKLNEKDTLTLEINAQLHEFLTKNKMKQILLMDFNAQQLIFKDEDGNEFHISDTPDSSFPLILNKLIGELHLDTLSCQNN